MTELRWVVNGQVVDVGQYEDKKPIFVRKAATKRVTLRAGWNQVMFRGYCFGYAPFGAGADCQGQSRGVVVAEIRGSAAAGRQIEQLWKLHEQRHASRKEEHEHG